MKLSSLIHFATFAIPYVTADSMGFSIRAPVEMADVMNVKRKHESEEDFVVEIPVKWPETYGSPEACMDEAGTLNFVPSNGECGDEPINRLVAIFNELIEGKNSVDISTPAYNLSCNFTATDNQAAAWIIGWGLMDYGYDVHMTCFNKTV